MSKLGVYDLNKEKDFNVISFINLPIKIQIKCVFNRRYEEETDIYRIATERTDCQSNLIISVMRKDGKTSYLYENNFEIIKYYDIRDFTNFSDILQKLKEKIKIYPFMQNHEITFKYACIIVISSNRHKILNNNYICDVKYNYRGVSFLRQSISNFRTGDIYYGCIVNDINEFEDFQEMLDSFQAQISIA